jgi:hypothetical protein
MQKADMVELVQAAPFCLSWRQFHRHIYARLFHANDKKLPILLAALRFLPFDFGRKC